MNNNQKQYGTYYSLIPCVDDKVLIKDNQKQCGTYYSLIPCVDDSVNKR